MRDYITIRYQSFQARVLLSELHLLDVLHFRRLISWRSATPGRTTRSWTRCGRRCRSSQK